MPFGIATPGFGVPTATPGPIPWWQQLMNSPGAGLALTQAGASLLGAPNLQQGLGGAFSQFSGIIAESRRREEEERIEQEKRRADEELNALRRRQLEASTKLAEMQVERAPELAERAGTLADLQEDKARAQLRQNERLAREAEATAERETALRTALMENPDVVGLDPEIIENLSPDNLESLIGRLPDAERRALQIKALRMQLMHSEIDLANKLSPGLPKPDERLGIAQIDSINRELKALREGNPRAAERLAYAKPEDLDPNDRLLKSQIDRLEARKTQYLEQYHQIDPRPRRDDLTYVKEGMPAVEAVLEEEPELVQAIRATGTNRSPAELILQWQRAGKFDLLLSMFKKTGDLLGAQQAVYGLPGV